MECWSSGVLEQKNADSFSVFSKSSTPVLHHSSSIFRMRNFGRGCKQRERGLLGHILMRQKALWLYLIVASVLAGYAVGGCGKKAGKDLEEVTYRLKWLFNISVVGDLYTSVHGHFADHGLHVTIKQGSPEHDAIKELELGHAQFGVASADQVLRAVSKGSPIVVLAQLFQTNPLQWMYRSEKTRIERPDDLKGKTVGITYGGNDETIMRALLSKTKMKNNEVKLFGVRYDYSPFYQGEVDLWPVYQNAEGIVIGEKLRRAGEQVGFFSPDTFGIQFVANSVITTRQMLKDRPETVERFTDALLQGWREALDPANEEKALAATQRFDTDTPLNIMREQLKATRRLIKPSSEGDIGRVNIEAWKQTERIMLEQKLIPGPVSLERILRGH